MKKLIQADYILVKYLGEAVKYFYGKERYNKIKIQIEARELYKKLFKNGKYRKK